MRGLQAWVTNTRAERATADAPRLRSDAPGLDLALETGGHRVNYLCFMVLAQCAGKDTRKRAGEPIRSILPSDTPRLR